MVDPVRRFRLVTRTAPPSYYDLGDRGLIAAPRPEPRVLAVGTVLDDGTVTMVWERLDDAQTALRGRPVFVWEWDPPGAPWHAEGHDPDRR